MLKLLVVSLRRGLVGLPSCCLVRLWSERRRRNLIMRVLGICGNLYLLKLGLDVCRLRRLYRRQGRLIGLVMVLRGLMRLLMLSIWIVRLRGL